MLGPFAFELHAGTAAPLARDLGAHFFMSGMVRSFKRLIVSANSGRSLVRCQPKAAAMTELDR